MSRRTLDARTAAALTTHAVIFKKRSLNDVFQQPPFSVHEDQTALWRELTYGVIRWYWPLAAHTDTLLRQPLKEKDRDIYCLLLVGMYQLLSLRTAPHAAVNETVNSVAKLKKKWARSLVNALLRQTLRQPPDNFPASADASTESTLASTTSSPDDEMQRLLSHPLWMLSLWRDNWPEHWVDIARNNNVHPSMTLRVNLRKGSREDYLATLREREIKAEPIDSLPGAIALESSIKVAALPGYKSGRVSVQDAGAQLAAALVDAKPGERVLDACAAPGGKCCYLLETVSELEVVALDIKKPRLNRVEESLQRLGLTAQLIAADAIDTPSWWDGKLFDRILIDAPCSGTGVISRHPDIKHLRRADDLDNYAVQQSKLLNALWPLLKPEGRLVYATCSLESKENEQVVQQFIDSTSDASVAQLDPNAIAETIQRSPGYQRLPTADGHDGFFYAVLRRSS